MLSLKFLNKKIRLSLFWDSPALTKLYMKPIRLPASITYSFAGNSIVSRLLILAEA